MTMQFGAHVVRTRNTPVFAASVEVIRQKIVVQEWRVSRSYNRYSNRDTSFDFILVAEFVCIGPLHTPYKESIVVFGQAFFVANVLDWLEDFQNVC